MGHGVKLEAEVLGVSQAMDASQLSAKDILSSIKVDFNARVTAPWPTPSAWWAVISMTWLLAEEVCDHQPGK